jgi:hypothetical protein
MAIYYNNQFRNYYLGATGSLGKMYYGGVEVNPGSGTAPAPTYSYLLDDYPGANAAYSFRKLKSTYTGSCITVRRSSDNTTSSIGFVDNILDTASLLSFVGAGSGFIRTWFDQSTNGNNANQFDDDTRQPSIVNSGSLFTLGSQLAMRPGLTIGSQLNILNQPINANTSIFVGKSLGNIHSAVGYAIGGFGENGFGIDINPGFGVTSGSVFYFNSPYLNDYASAGGNYNLSEFYFTGSAGSEGNGYYNNNLVVSGSSNTLPAAILCSRPGNFFMNGLLQEIIMYPTSKISDRSDIASNINNYYSIY